MNKISDEQIMNYIQKQYDYLMSEYDANRILGVFAQGIVNFGFAEQIEDINIIACYIPTFEELCGEHPQSIIITNGDSTFTLTDIRMVLTKAKQQKEVILEAVFTDYCIINPMYQKIFTNSIYMDREAMFRCNKKMRIETAFETATNAIKDYQQTGNRQSLFTACRKRIAARLYLNGTAIENCINLKKDYHINYLWGILDGTIEPDLQEIIDDLNEMKKECATHGRNRADEKLITEYVIEIVKLALNPVPPKEEFLSNLTDAEKEALQVINNNLPEREGNISISKVLLETSVSRPVFKNLLRKMEECNYAQIENQGVKGTYIKFLEEE